MKIERLYPPRAVRREDDFLNLFFWTTTAATTTKAFLTAGGNFVGREGFGGLKSG